MSDTTTTAPTKDPRTITVRGRLRYVWAHKPQQPKEKNKDGSDKQPRYSATVTFDKVEGKDQIQKLGAGVRIVCEQEWPGKQVKLTTGKTLSNKDATEKVILKGICLRDGTEKDDKEGFGDGVMFLTSGGYDKPQILIKRDGKVVPLEEASGKPYAGCYVAVTVRLWPQKDEKGQGTGKMVNAELLAICFIKDGEKFGKPSLNVEQEFGDIEDAEEESADSTSDTGTAASPEDEEW